MSDDEPGLPRVYQRVGEAVGTIEQLDGIAVHSENVEIHGAYEGSERTTVRITLAVTDEVSSDE